MSNFDILFWAIVLVLKFGGMGRRGANNVRVPVRKTWLARMCYVRIHLRNIRAVGWGWGGVGVGPMTFMYACETHGMLPCAPFVYTYATSTSNASVYSATLRYT